MPGTDRRRQRHYRGRAGVDQSAGIHKIVVGIGQHDEALFHK